MSLKDSLFNEETTKATTRIAMQYEFDQEKKKPNCFTKRNSSVNALSNTA
ncbi:MAG: hypothetical protein HC892_19165, partial [Saprospiraceae bacterium]|nr:hypothetical protein [Saprospiraceae bacterium]